MTAMWNGAKRHNDLTKEVGVTNRPWSSSVVAHDARVRRFKRLLCVPFDRVPPSYSLPDMVTLGDLPGIAVMSEPLV